MHYIRKLKFVHTAIISLALGGNKFTYNFTFMVLEVSKFGGYGGEKGVKKK